MKSSISQFYVTRLKEGKVKDAVLTADCPFCKMKGQEKVGKITVFLNESSFFYGYFRCSSFCVDGGFAPWFASLAGIDPASVPGYVEEVPLGHNLEYPQKNINAECHGFMEKLHQEPLGFFSDASIGDEVLKSMGMGYNGRYLVYPYSQLDGNVYSARCVNPDRSEDYFWFGDESFAEGSLKLFNVEEIIRCSGGTLFLCEGEENLLAIKQLGFPGVAYWNRTLLEEIDPLVFSMVRTLFIVPKNNIESYSSARIAASRIGFKVRLLHWGLDCSKDYTLRQFAIDSGKEFGRQFSGMIKKAKPFSPFATPERENKEFFSTLADQASENYASLLSGFPSLDERIGGIHGLNILGGGPKVGKSCFMIQIATEMALRKIPVLYYDFENGRQRIYERTFSRMAKIEVGRLQKREDLGDEEKQRYTNTEESFKKLLSYFRVVNDRKVSPDLMRRHIDFLRHETNSDYTVVVVDSLHKLPFKDLSEMRTGIDSWLRQMESIRDELGVSFLVVSELSRGGGGKYDDEPHMGAFKGSGDIEYSADNAMVLLPDWDHMHAKMEARVNSLWLVGSREHSPGLVSRLMLDYPFWGFSEIAGD